MSFLPETEPYRVLARKYRPAGFSGLIGQEAMVRTLANAIRTGRLAQAWLLTGVRGVGKTSTARIIAKCLNCTGADGSGGPTIEPCGQCEACTGIAAGQHIDVIEIDAASNTGVDDVREIIEAVRYAPASARFKIYIIDEVHMLSKAAFNALLKTLEEPPPHVKFVLATTEVDKVPATILSRCQRFDLKRVPARMVAAHLATIAEAEGIEAEPAALQLIARVAEGSVRDGLSILDQAIAMGGGRVTEPLLRDLLGLAERGRTVRLFAALVDARVADVLAEIGAAWETGIEPIAVIRDLLDLVHGLTRERAGGPPDPALGEAEAALLGERKASLDFIALHRLWQLLLKAHDEVRDAPQPLDAAEMALLRIAHAAGLPGPEELLGLVPAAPPPAYSPPPSAPPSAPPSGLPSDLASLVARLEAAREPQLARLLHEKVACRSFSAEAIELVATALLPADFLQRLRARVADLFGRPVDIRLVPPSGGEASLRDRELAGEAARREAALAHPAVATLIAAFPQAELLSVQPVAKETPA
ncbi:DNA polymerase III subunit gamma/tau [Thermaurantiacus sp.]